MKNNWYDKLDFEASYDYENAFYLTSNVSRIAKLMAHYDLYKLIAGVDGDVAEIGVYKGASFVRFMTFHNLIEKDINRKFYGFDAFGDFPTKDVHFDDDLQFIKKFEADGGAGINKTELEKVLQEKGFDNFELIKGNIFDTIPHKKSLGEIEKISLLHIDVDVYEPTLFALKELYPLVSKNGVVVLDDYNSVQGATKAIDEFFCDKRFRIEKTPYSDVPYFFVKEE